jgi:putative ABC transport system permease protein
LADVMKHDVAYAIRRLWREPGFAATAILILAVGIGACTAMFSIVQAVLLRPLGINAADRVVMMWASSTQHAAVGELSYTTYRDLFDPSRSFENVAILGSVNWSGTMNLAAGAPVRMSAAQSLPPPSMC